jgi:acyl-CoA reductase-like NAD-dependent aldehyde dehydrogenase
MEALLLINNAGIPASNGRTFERHDPLTGALVTRAAAAKLRDAQAAADTAAAALPAWAAVKPTERRRLLLAAADILASRSDEFADFMMGETGASRPWVNFNVGLAANMLREVASFVTQINGQVHTTELSGCLSISVRQPVGVVLGIAPWNAPVILAVRAIAAPLACGNTVILKASEISPGTQALLGKVFADAGFPLGVVNVVSNAPADAGKVVELLIAHSAVRRVGLNPRRTHCCRDRRPAPQARAAGAWRKKHRSWCSTMPTSIRRSMRSHSARSSIKDKFACRRSASWWTRQ